MFGNRVFRFALFAAVVGAAGSTSAQSGGRSISDTYRDQIGYANSAPTVSRVIRDTQSASRGQGFVNPASGQTLTNSSISSGFGRTPASAGIPTLPGAGGGAKPFSSIDRGPTVSPYLNLFNTGIGGSSTVDNYNLLVRPQLNQQSFNQQSSRQQQQLNQRVQSLSAQPQLNPQGSEQIISTGHSTVFGYHSRYYPGLSQRRPQKAR